MAEENEAPENEGAPKKKKMNMLTVLSMSQMVFTGALGGFLIWSLGNMNSSTPNHEELKERAIASVKDEVREIQFMDLDPFVTNTMTKNTVKATFNIEVSDAQTAETLKQRMPAIRARILTLLSQQNGKSLRRMQDKLLLKDALRETMNQELEKNGSLSGVVRDVYFVDFLVI